jgi:uncharacterized membrane protein YGL010W
MRRIDALLADYGSSHRTRGNLACHAAGITLIVFGTLAMLDAVRLSGRWTAAELLIAAAAIAYLSLDLLLGLATIGAVVLLDFAAHAVASWRWGLAAFVLGWIFQGIGHAVYERNSPAFVRNLVHLLVGPAFLVNEALRIRRPSAQTPVSRMAPAAINKKSS